MDLSNVFPPDCIRLDVDLPDKDSVFTYLGECFFNCGILTDPKAYLDTVRLRETLSETGLSQGIAIPHGVSASVKREGIAYVRLKHAIPWESLDGKPIRHVFLLAIPINSNQGHIRLLSQLARRLIREEVIEQIDQIQRPLELLQLLS